jgi:hypothetical protein
MTSPTTTPAVTAAKATATKARETARTAKANATAAAKAAAEAAKTAKEAAAAAPKAKTARDYVREIDAKILTFAGEAIELTADLPAEMRVEVAALIANQLHHLATPKTGWVGSLPTPDRSEWK